ncbi:hypothetical protein [Oceanisphaera sp. KMM 10153]|uniref:phage major tropism determinant n=1 Tax=Oceanisphaera submarina TaxID=3390193 RepID=UPI003976FD13
MSQYDFGVIDPAATSGTQLAGLITQFRDAVNSNHKGAARPTYVRAGMMWVKETSATQWDLMLYDGQIDLLLRSLNPQTHKLLPLPLTQGGTGGESAAQAKVNLGLDKVRNVASYSQDEINNLLAASVLTKADLQSPCIKKTGAGAVSIKANTTVLTGTGVVTFAIDTAVTMPGTLNAGENYGVWVKPDGSAVAVEAPTNAGPYNWGNPPVADAVLIGGFHYSLTAPGTTPATGSFATSGFTNQGGNYPWTQAQIDKIAGVNEYSIWDLLFRPKTYGLKGFVFDPETRIWVAAYFCGTDHISDGPSRAGSNVASGTVLPKIPLAYGGDGTATYGRLSWYEANEIALSHGCRILDYQEFASAALGVTEGQSLGGASVTIPITLRQPGYTSRLGLEQACGHQWIWGANANGTGGSGWVAGPNRGNSYGTPYAGLFGSYRAGGSHSGSRAAAWDNPAWNSGGSLSLRVACDHMQPV